MLTIRNAQLQRLAEDYNHDLRLWIAEHLQRQFAEQLKGLTSEQLTGFVLRNYRKAVDRGIDTGPGICTFVDLAVMLGPDFDSSPAFPWVERTLSDDSIPDPNRRIQLVAQMAARIAGGS